MEDLRYYYTEPTQIRYIRDGENHYGIVYKTIVIDAVDGIVYDIDEIFNNARHLGYQDDDIIGERDWNDLTALIK